MQGPDIVRSPVTAAILCILVIAAAGSSGCIRLVQRTLDGSGETVVKDPSFGAQDASSAIPTGRTAGAGSPAGASTCAGSNGTAPPAPLLVAEAAPILAKEARTVRQTGGTTWTVDAPPLVRLPEFSKAYTLRGNAIGLVANVTKGPLIIGFDIEPEYDCIDDPGSCRGTATSTVNRPYCTITVRENRSLAIVAQDGYGKEFSAKRLNRSVTVYGQGIYHITLEGTSLDITLSLTSGAAPWVTSGRDPAGAATATPSRAAYEMILRHREGG